MYKRKESKMSFTSAMKRMSFLLLHFLLLLLLMVVMTVSVSAMKIQKQDKCHWQKYTGSDGQLHSVQICS